MKNTKIHTNRKEKRETPKYTPIERKSDRNVTPQQIAIRPTYRS
jgi:hypothetical protein